MEQSILKSTKKLLGIEPDDTSYDLDLTTYINSEFSTLTGLGVGPAAGFFIEDDTAKWSELLVDLDSDEVQLNLIKIAVYLRVRLVFDPPGQTFLIDALQKQLTETEWRLNTNREATDWTDPTPVTVPEPSEGFGL